MANCFMRLRQAWFWFILFFHNFTHLAGSDSCVASSVACQGLSAPTIVGVGCQVWWFGGIIAIAAAKELRLL